MKEIWEQAILAYNLPLTILLGVVMLFWIFTLLGAVGLDMMDADLDADADGDIGDVPGALLKVVNAGSVPLTVVLSILILVMWLVSITLNYYFNPTHGILLAIGFFVAAFVVGVIATKVLTQPLVPLMRRIKEAENTAPVVGETGVVRSIEIDSKFGQIEVQREDGAPALLNARLGEDSTPLARGSTVVVISLDEKTGLYLVRELPTPSLTD